MNIRVIAISPIFFTFVLLTGLVWATTTPSQSAAPIAKKKRKRKSPSKAAARTASPKAMTAEVSSLSAASSKHFVATAATQSKTFRPTVRRRSSRGLWDEPTYADSTLGDNVDGEDLDVRRAAVEALGPLNGAVVVSDPNTGRILTMVNQKLALSDGYQPCSTIKVPVAFAALSEGIIEPETMRKIYGRTKINLTQALAKSNNQYFAGLGEELGYQKVSYYAHLFGLGEKAGLDIPGEHAGHFPSEPPKNGGMGMLTSFGEEISLTPLQLAAIMGSIANGGTLYYLQHPRSKEEIEKFTPKVKRQVDVQQWLPVIRPGMLGATEYGTARRVANLGTTPIFGKTGTCTDSRSPTHLGWFGSYNEVGDTRLVVVVLLTGGRPVNGPVASGIAGSVYKNLAAENFFAQSGKEGTTATAAPAIISTQSCCR